MPPTEKHLELAEVIVEKFKKCLKPCIIPKKGMVRDFGVYTIISTSKAENFYDKFEWNEEYEMWLPLYSDEFDEEHGWIDVELSVVFDKKKNRCLY